MSHSKEFGPNTPVRPFYPGEALVQGSLVLLIVAFTFVVATAHPWAIGEKANPLVTPNPIKPQWYFLAIYQLLKLLGPPYLPFSVPEWIGAVAIPTGFLVVLLLLPFYDQNPYKSVRRRPLGLVLGILTIVVFVGLTWWGAVSKT
ncbi:MAG TPA: hypothetical protein VNJ51_12150 [Candidatus Dormibacteraeota bacterium]|nr:hypothetical protein [Candidatus Dormibacteraeota bacterium]